jgi:HEAT repeat protein
MLQPDESPLDKNAQPAEFSTGGMLVRLILLPGLVVLAIVLTIVWFSRPGGDVDSLIDTLAREGDHRWLAAASLSAVLHEPEGAAIRRDPAVARRLIEILQKEIKVGGLEAGQLSLRMHLCRALGEFRIADPLPVLLEAAQLQRDEREVDVRRAAIEGIAVLAFNLGAAEGRSRAQLVPVLLEAAEDRHRQIRETAAFALGVVGGDRAEVRLERMLADRYAEVRYNAATGLARQGNAECIGVLREMLDPQQADSRQTTFRENALQATAKLAAANPRADLSELAEAVERLTRAGVEAEVRAKAAEVFEQLDRRRGTPDGSRS